MTTPAAYDDIYLDVRKIVGTKRGTQSTTLVMRTIEDIMNDIHHKEEFVRLMQKWLAST